MKKITLYQVPFSASTIDRFIRVGDDWGEIGKKIKEITFTKNEFSFIKVNAMVANLKISENLDFNYVIIEGIKHLKKTKHAWMVLGKDQLVSQDNYLYNLKLDILMSFNLFKNVDDIKVNTIRESTTQLIYNDSDDSVVLTDERNPRIWSSNTFPDAIPFAKEIKNFSFNSFFSATDKTFADGTPVYKPSEKYKNTKIQFSVRWPNDWSITYEYTDRYPRSIGWQPSVNVDIPLSCILSILNKVIRTSNYENDNTIANIAIKNVPYVNKSLGIYYTTTKTPIFYGLALPVSAASIRSAINPTITTSRNRWDNEVKSWRRYKENEMALKSYYVSWFKRTIDASGIFTDDYGNSINVNDDGFTIFMNRLIPVLEGSNDITKITADKDHSGIYGFLDWFNDAQIPHNRVISSLFGLYNGDYWFIKTFPSGGQNVIKKTYSISTHTFAIDDKRKNELSNKNITLHKTVLNTKVKFSKAHLKLNDNMIKNYDVYKWLYPQLFNEQYNPWWIEIAGVEISLNKFLLYTNENVYTKTWFGSTEQNVSLYQGELGSNNKILNPEYVQKIALSIPIEYSSQQGEINYQLRANALNAKLSEAALAQQRDNKLISESLDAKARRIEAVKDVNINAATRVLASIQKEQEALRLSNSYRNVLGGGATGFILGKGSIGAAITGAGIGLVNSIFDQQRLGISQAAQNEQLRISNAQAEAVAIQDQVALRREAQAQQKKINQDAYIKALITNAEIADIKNVPNVNQNQTNITKFLSIEKNVVSLNNLKLNEKTEKILWRYFNIYGNEKVGLLELQNNWWDTHMHFTFIQGGEWSKYLYKLGITSSEIVNEFNALFNNGGLRIWNRKNVKGYYGGENYDINYDWPNWPNQIFNKIKWPPDKK